jgi:hypothetical protein
VRSIPCAASNPKQRQSAAAVRSSTSASTKAAICCLSISSTIVSTCRKY